MECHASTDPSAPLAAVVSAPAPGELMATYDDGVRAVLRIAARFTAAAWELPTSCSQWRAADLAAHLRCVAEDYHEYLDDAPESRLSKLMASGAPASSIARKLARQNAAELAWRASRRCRCCRTTTHGSPCSAPQAGWPADAPAGRRCDDGQQERKGLTGHGVRREQVARGLPRAGRRLRLPRRRGRHPGAGRGDRRD